MVCSQQLWADKVGLCTAGLALLGIVHDTSMHERGAVRHVCIAQKLYRLKYSWKNSR